MPLPYLTSDLPGIGGVIKSRPEEFFVQEIPLYEPCGAGEHLYIEIQKINLTTLDAINQIARKLGISSRDIGYAGLKDARAVTRQVLSLPRITPEQVTGLDIPNLQVLSVLPHNNKLRLGHLAGNRFAIKLREVNPMDVVNLRPIVSALEKRGVPNYFGEQRFGRRGDNARLGAALIRDDAQTLLRQLLGSPNPHADGPEELCARAAFEEGNIALAAQLFPHHARLELTILNRLIKTGNPAAAIKAIDQRLRRLWISALQSRVFNNVLAQRIDAIDQLWDGDIACKPTGACFFVESAAMEQPRCDSFEISPTGPLLGCEMRLPQHEPLAIEQAAFAALDLAPADFRLAGRHKVRGARRPLRFRPTDIQLEAGVDSHGPFITAAFTLPAGAYATVFLRELTKSDDLPAPEASQLEPDSAATAETQRTPPAE